MLHTISRESMVGRIMVMSPEINWSPPLQPRQEIRAPRPDNGSSDLYQRAQQEGFGPLADQLGYVDLDSAGAARTLRDEPQEAATHPPGILGQFTSNHSEIADELHEHREREREEMGEAEGFLGEEGDADARKKNIVVLSRI